MYTESGKSYIENLLMDIKSGKGYPSNSLSNFAPHNFVVDGVDCASMEGFLQSLKFSNPEMQKAICKMVGFAAKKAGSNKNWKTKQILYWNNVEYERNSKEYQQLLDRAYNSLSRNDKFRKALLATGNAVLTHSIGRRRINETVLTRSEFCSRLMKHRETLKWIQK